MNTLKIDVRILLIPVGKIEMLMYFAFKWKHRDGAMVEFEPDGWSSDDPAKTAWLKIESGLSNPWPIIPAAIRLWLQQQCELIEFRGIVPECSE